MNVQEPSPIISNIINFKMYFLSKFVSLLILTFFHYNSVLLQRLVNCHTCYCAPNSESRKRNLTKKSLFPEICHFYKEKHFSKNQRT